ncbi:hypothetical protein KCP69_08380 [Salmonella enterica subsp. enterica]|nr:hypothetical protein KCP69_08380 [Salmonella enterica subsp. enterica]
MRNTPWLGTKTGLLHVRRWLAYSEEERTVLGHLSGNAEGLKNRGNECWMRLSAWVG